MRKLVSGLDASGKSYLVSAEEVVIDKPVSEGLHMRILHAVGDIAPGKVRWQFLAWEPGATYPMHDTETIDYLLTLAGGGEIELDDGFHAFEEGDVIVFEGHMHGWRIGPEGALLSCVTVPITKA